MAILSRNQRIFASALAQHTGLDPRLIGAWIVAEEPAGASTPVGHNDQNWLNIGNTDSKWYGGARAWRDPAQAGANSAAWLQGKLSVPGFGKAAPGIQAFARTAGKPLQTQIQALQQSGWASSGYPHLPGLVSKYAGHFGINTHGASLGGGAGTPAGPARIAVQGGSGASQGLAALLGQIGQRQRPQIESAGLAVPAFAAHAVMPQGYQQAPSGGGPVQQASSLAELLGQVAQLQGPTASVAPGGSARTTTGGSARGKVIVAPGADRAGVPTSNAVRGFLALLAGSVGHPITITTGSNHSQMTVDGNVSDHWSGNAADIGVPVDSRQGDMIAGRALLLAGVPRLQARKMAQQGGLYTLTPKSGPLAGKRVQVIWKTNEGGDHHKHVHVGIR